MKVLLVLPGGIRAGDSRGHIPALETFATRLARHCELCVLLVNRRRQPGRYRASGFDVVMPGMTGWPVVGAARDRASAAAMLRDFDFDVVHSFWLGRPGRFAQHLLKERPAPWVASVGGQELVNERRPETPAFRRRLLRARNRRVLGAAQVVTGGSRRLVDEIRERGFSAEWWPLFPDKALFRPADTAAGPRGDVFRIITVADHNAAKDVPTLLRTIRELRRRGHSVRLDWLGRELREGESRRQAEALGIADCVRIRGRVPHEQVAAHLRDAGAYLQTSRYESQGVSVCEATACGLPIVGTAVGILPEIGPAGSIAVAPGDAAALAKGIERLILDPDLGRALGRGAAEWMAAYSADWTVDAALGFYRSLLQDRPGLSGGPARRP